VNQIIAKSSKYSSQFFCQKWQYLDKPVPYIESKMKLSKLKYMNQINGNTWTTVVLIWTKVANFGNSQERCQCWYASVTHTRSQ